MLAGAHGIAILDLFVEPLGDVNGDGFDDLAVENWVVFSDAVGSPLSRDDANLVGRGFEIRRTLSDVRPGLYAAGDVNGDGRADIWVISGEHWVVYGKEDLAAIETADVENGVGGFSIRDFSPGWPLADIDGDENDELVLVLGDEYWVVSGKQDTSVLDGGVVPFATFNDAPVAAGDLDGDGIVEFLVCGNGPPRIESAPEGWGGAPRRTSAFDLPDEACGEIRDLDGDGVGDVLLWYYSPGEWPMYTGWVFRGPLELASAVIPPSGGSWGRTTYREPRLLDAKGDGKFHVLGAHRVRGDNLSLPDAFGIWLESSARWEVGGMGQCEPVESPIVIGDFPQTYPFLDLAGDVNGDGRDDVIFIQTGKSSILTEVCEP